MEKRVNSALFQIQEKLKAPKSNYNDFSGFPYRSCEDILAAVKPLLAEVHATLTLEDDVVEVGGRVYIRATARLNADGEDEVAVSAFAREAESKKGMDSSQVSGSASSYARKYCLAGLFAIDGSGADPDSMDNRDDKSAKYRLSEICTERGLSKSEVAQRFRLSGKSSERQFAEAVRILEGEK